MGRVMGMSFIEVVDAQLPSITSLGVELGAALTKRTTGGEDRTNDQDDQYNHSEKGDEPIPRCRMG